MLIIKNLKAKTEDKHILNGVNLEVNHGEVHAIMGQNGSGKSTLGNVLAGNDSYEIVAGKVDFLGENLFELGVDERAIAGLFLAFQYPVEIPGVNFKMFLFTAYNALRVGRGQAEVSNAEFNKILQNSLKKLSISKKYLKRDVNVGFSGGEKKKNDILQMSVLAPKLCILDETDSGLDIDALKLVSNGINSLRSKDRSFILITHYIRLLDYVKPDFVHIFYDGRIIKSGNYSLAIELEKSGYDSLITNYCKSSTGS